MYNIEQRQRGCLNEGWGDMIDATARKSMDEMSVWRGARGSTVCTVPTTDEMTARGPTKAMNGDTQVNTEYNNVSPPNDMIRDKQ